MKTPIFDPLRFNLYFSKHQLGLHEAPNSRDQNLSSQGSNLVFLRHKTLGIQPYHRYRLQLDLLEDSYPLGLQPTTSIRQHKFHDFSQLPISSAMISDNIFTFSTSLKWSPRHLAHKWQLCLLRRCQHCSSSHLNNFSKVTPWGPSTMHHDFQGCLQNIFMKSSKCL